MQNKKNSPPSSETHGGLGLARIQTAARCVASEASVPFGPQECFPFLVIGLLLGGRLFCPNMVGSQLQPWELVPGFGQGRSRPPPISGSRVHPSDGPGLGALFRIVVLECGKLEHWGARVRATRALGCSSWGSSRIQILEVVPLEHRMPGWPAGLNSNSRIA